MLMCVSEPFRAAQVVYSRIIEDDISAENID